VGERNFTPAAAQLDFSQSALSGTSRASEERMGLPSYAYDS
jgi:DNA-binding transcriptional LysR family regulator